MAAAAAIAVRKAASTAAAAVQRLETVERDAALRECLAEQDLHRLDAAALEKAIAAGREKGATASVLEKAEARMEEWRKLQDLIAEQAKGVATWRVVNPLGFVNIRLQPSATAHVLDTVEPGTIVRGTLAGDWLKLSDRLGYMLTVKPSGEPLMEPFQGASLREGGKQESLKWVVKLLRLDRLAREAFMLLAPEFHNADYDRLDCETLGARMLEIGHRLYEEGSLPGNPTWEMEECPEVLESLDFFARSLQATGCAEFHDLLTKATNKAEEGYVGMGHLAPRLASLRWNCCLRWLSARSEAVAAVSAGASFGTVTPQRSDAACRAAKHAIFDYLRPLCKEYELLAMFDYDLVGNGVWHDSKREPLPKRAEKEWYRRGMEFDVMKLCHQANLLPPEDMNPSAATFTLVQPYLTPDWILPPPEASGHIIRKHDWIVVPFTPKLEDLHTKALVAGPVWHIEQPQEYQHDFGDPEVIAKVQRGEDLGKGPQADGKPGAVHASVALYFAAMFSMDKVQNLCVYPGLLQLEGFFKTLLEYGPPIEVLELRGVGDACTEEVLELIALAGSSLRILDLSDCALDDDGVAVLIDVLESLPNLKHLDVGDNQLESSDALLLVSTLCERRIDVPSIRFDGNPMGDIEQFKNEVSQLLVARGEQVVAGGELVLHLEDDMLRWCPAAKEGQLASRLRDETTMPPKMVAIKEVRTMANATKRQLDKYEKSNPAATTSGGRDWLRRQREVNEKVLGSSMIGLYKAEIQHRVAAKEAAEAADAGAAAMTASAAAPAVKG